MGHDMYVTVGGYDGELAFGCHTCEGEWPIIREGQSDPRCGEQLAIQDFQGLIDRHYATMGDPGPCASA